MVAKVFEPLRLYCIFPYFSHGSKEWVKRRPVTLAVWVQIPLGWSGGAMVLGKLPVQGRPTLWMIVGRGPTALAVGAGGVVWTFLLSTVVSLFFLPVFGRQPDID